MPSLTELATKAKKNPGRPCSVGLFLADLSDQDRAEVLDVLHDPRIPDAALVAALEATHDAVPRTHCWGHHRRGDCACG